MYFLARSINMRNVTRTQIDIMHFYIFVKYYAESSQHDCAGFCSSSYHVILRTGVGGKINSPRLIFAYRYVFQTIPPHGNISYTERCNTKTKNQIIKAHTD